LELYHRIFVEVILKFFFTTGPQLFDQQTEVVLGNCRSVQAAFAEHGLIANVRLETYVGESYFRVPPPAK